MYLLGYSVKSGREGTFEDAYKILRDNGCHSPTRDSIRTTFRALKTLAMLNKLHGKGLHERVPVLDFLKQVNGPEARLDLTGVGWEFSGWFTELMCFEAASLIDVSGKSILMKLELHKLYFQRAASEEVVLEQLYDKFQEFHTFRKVQQRIIERVTRFGLVNVLLEATFVEREGGLNGE